MKAPKILPWIAKQAGISEALALKLWRRASGEAEQLTGKAEGSEYWGLVMERFLSLAAQEGNLPLEVNHLMPAPELSWVWRHQNRMSQLSLMTAQNAYHFWQNAWQKLYMPKEMSTEARSQVA